MEDLSRFDEETKDKTILAIHKRRLLKRKVVLEKNLAEINKILGNIVEREK